MDIGHDLKKHLRYLSKETRKDCISYKETIEILIKLHTYILANLANVNCFAKLDFTTDCVFLKAWQYESVRLFLFNLGWRLEKNLLVMKKPENLKIGVDVLWSFKKSENGPNSAPNTCENELKLIGSLENNRNPDDDHGSQGFNSEIELNLEKDAQPKTSPPPPVSSASDASDVDLSISPTRIDSFPNASSCKSKEYTQLNYETVGQQPTMTVACHKSYSIPIEINPFLGVAYFMQTALDAVAPVFYQPGSLVSQIYKSTKQMFSVVSGTASTAVSGIRRVSAITISPGPQNSININSSNFFGSAAVNIKSDRNNSNNTIFRLLTENCPVDSRITLPSKSDGSVNRPKIT